MSRSLQAALAVALFAVVGGVAWLAHAEPLPVNESLKDWAGSLEHTDGFCLDAVGAAADVWASEPARITTARQGEIRYVTVKHADSVDSTLPVCFALGSDLGATLTCDPLGAGASTTAGLLTGYGSFGTVHVRRTKQAGSTSGAVPALHIAAAAGDTVRVCIEVGR